VVDKATANTVSQIERIEVAIASLPSSFPKVELLSPVMLCPLELDSEMLELIVLMSELMSELMLPDTLELPDMLDMLELPKLLDMLELPDMLEEFDIMLEEFDIMLEEFDIMLELTALMSELMIELMFELPDMLELLDMLDMLDMLELLMLELLDMLELPDMFELPDMLDMLVPDEMDVDDPVLDDCDPPVQFTRMLVVLSAEIPQKVAFGPVMFAAIVLQSLPG